MRTWLKQAREAKNLTQKELGAKLDISESYVCCIESLERKKKLDIDMVQKISKTLKIPISKIIEYEKEVK